MSSRLDDDIKPGHPKRHVCRQAEGIRHNSSDDTSPAAVEGERANPTHVVKQMPRHPHHDALQLPQSRDEDRYFAAMDTAASGRHLIVTVLSTMTLVARTDTAEQTWSVQQEDFYVAPLFPPSFAALVEIRAPKGLCWFTTSECVKHPHFSKRLVDTGRQGIREKDCFAMASQLWRFCGNPEFVPVAMLFPELNSSAVFPDEARVHAVWESVDFRILSAGYANQGSAQVTPDLDSVGMQAFSPGVSSFEESGWKTVHVWVGGSSYRSRTAWNGQFQQDKLVVDIFGGKTGGFFVDLAAYDAVMFSNTLTLEQDFGWDGLCIEASERHIHGLSHRKCSVVHAMIGSTTGDKHTFALSGWCGAACAGIAGVGEESAGKAKHRAMRSVSVDLILEDFEAPAVIDYLSLDLEGAEDMALSSFPFHRHQLLSLSIERPSAYAVTLLSSHGFHFLCRFPAGHADGYDEFWVHASIPDFHHIIANWGEPVPDRSRYE